VLCPLAASPPTLAAGVRTLDARATSRGWIRRLQRASTPNQRTTLPMCRAPGATAGQAQPRIPAPIVAQKQPQAAQLRLRSTPSSADTPPFAQLLTNSQKRLVKALSEPPAPRKNSISHELIFLVAVGRHIGRGVPRVSSSEGDERVNGKENEQAARRGPCSAGPFRASGAFPEPGNQLAPGLLPAGPEAEEWRKGRSWRRHSRWTFSQTRGCFTCITPTTVGCGRRWRRARAFRMRFSLPCARRRPRAAPSTARRLRCRRAHGASSSGSSTRLGAPAPSQ
jgi:hypothetical protein